MKKALLVLLMAPMVAHAGSQVGKITKLISRSDNLHYFFVEGTPNSKPSCATSNYWIIKDENSISGKTQISMLLTAYTAGREVTVVGTNDCTRWGDGEDVHYIEFNQI